MREVVVRNSYFDAVNGKARLLQAALGMNKPAGDMINAHHQIVMRGSSGLTPALREAVAALVSALNMCPLCHNAHIRVAELLGYDRAVIETARLDIAVSGAPEQDIPLFIYAKKMTLAPSTLSQRDKDDVIAAGWSEQDLHDMINVACIFNFINRFVLSHGIHVAPEFVEQSAQMITSVGYWDLEKNRLPAMGKKT
ncbi:MAG: hypothetical protein AAGB02_00130 [Pseudomonadota bacterium]